MGPKKKRKRQKPTKRIKKGAILKKYDAEIKVRKKALNKSVKITNRQRKALSDVVRKRDKIKKTPANKL